MEIRGQDNRGRAAEKRRELLLVFQDVDFLGLKNDFKMTPTSADVFLCLLRAVAITVFPDQFRLRGAPAIRTFDSHFSHLLALL